MTNIQRGDRADIRIDGNTFTAEILKVAKFGTRVQIVIPFFYSQSGIYRKGKTDHRVIWVDTSEILH